MSSELSHHEALIYIMVTMSAVDRKMTDEELSSIGDMVSKLPVFRDFDSDSLVHVAEACGDMLSHDGGLDNVLNRVARGLPPKLRETAYALAVEIAAADLDVQQEEMRLLELLAEALGLDRLITAAIERGARARLARP
ncbi:MAG: tellurite resistance TerB family protein [Pseudomonadota bacterium]|nr:tellurite resistance TerB family protein [Pseudomonadota bacterium]